VVVGPFSDPERLVFEGIQTFTAEEIRLALTRAPDFLLASHPAAGFSEYLSAVKSLVQTGYQQCGFPDVQVSAGLDETGEAIGIQVSEGPRYVCGIIEVTGADTLPIQLVTQKMTERRITKADVAAGNGKPGKSKTEDPIWQSGKPAPFAKPSLDILTGRIKSVLAALGYCFSTFTVTVVPEPETSTARLVVRVQAEGSRTISEIHISGHKKNTREDILQFLGLEEGMPLDHDLLQKTQGLLLRSARFLHYCVTPEVDVDREAITLKIDLREYGHAPTLSEGFSPEESVLLRFGEWLSDFCQREEDLMVSVPVGDTHMRLQAVVSPNQGMTLTLLRDNAPEGADPFAAAILTQERMVFFSLTNASKFVWPKAPAHIIAQLSLTPDPDPNEGKLFRFTPGIAMNNDKSGDPYSLDINLAPVFFVYCAHRDGIDVTHLLDQGIVTSGLDKAYTVKIDPPSGRLLAVTHASSSSDGGQMALILGRGLFDRSVARIETMTSDYANGFVPQRPVGSTLRYLSECPLFQWALFQKYGDQWACSEEALGRAVTLLGGMLEQAVQPFDQWVLERRPVKKDRFPVPHSDTRAAASPMGLLVSNMAAQVCVGCNQLFPPGSWPLALARETVYVIGGMGKYTDRELRLIYLSPQTGPLGYLTTAKLLTYVNEPLSRTFALRGLERLDFKDFHRDWRLLMDQDHLLFRCFDRMARAVRDLEDRDVDALLVPLPAEYGRFLRDGITCLRADEDTPVSKALAVSLELLWEKKLRGDVIQALRELIFPAGTSG
jgi:hypothetical protein